MLLRFETDNYKNFADGFTLSMVPNMMQKDLTWSILKEQTPHGLHKALSSAVIFGPNASGKSNLISAADTFKQIVSRGNILNGTHLAADNKAGSMLELLPNRFVEEPRPVTFGIEFVHDKTHFDYVLSADLGAFMDRRHPRAVVSEELTVNGVLIFTRHRQKIDFGDLNAIDSDIWGNSIGDDRLAMAKLSAETIQPTDLYIRNGFRMVVSPKIAERFSGWVSEGLRVECNSQNLTLTPELKNANSEGLKFETVDSLSKILRKISPNADWATYLIQDGIPKDLYVKLDKTAGTQMDCVIPADIYESYGTIRLLRILPAIENALSAGTTLMMDEFDASLHPAIAAGIISAFHNDEINVNNAQLIVNTHNLVHMNSDLYRRDEIHLVNPDWTKHSSDHYTLADFKGYGDKSVRKNEAYMRKYVKEAYGAYPNIDIGELIEAFLGAKNKTTVDTQADAELQKHA